jgi:large subunit ribosomal protein L10
MQKSEKERVVADLAEQLRAADSLIVADYRGLTNSQLETLRARLRPHGARLTVVKNTLTRRAAEAAGAESLLALLEGPTALAFVAAEGDPLAVAKALSDTARETRILAFRGGVMQGSPITGDDVEQLAKLPPVDVLQAQLVGVIVAPLTQLLGLLTAPLRDLVGLIDARIAQLEEDGAVVVEEPADAAEAEPAPEAAVEAEAPIEAEASAEAETEAAEPEVAAGEDVSAETAETSDEESE